MLAGRARRRPAFGVAAARPPPAGRTATTSCSTSTAPGGRRAQADRRRRRPGRRARTPTIGVATVRSSDAASRPGGAPSARWSAPRTTKPIGHAPSDAARQARRRREGRHRAAASARRQGRRRAAKARQADPLASAAVGHADDRRDRRRLLRAPAGRHGVRVGIIDTGIDGSTPTSRRTSTRSCSRNFTVDDPGRSTAPCDDRSGPSSCDDPADVDEDGHGTHVAGTIGVAAQRHRHRRRRAEGRPRQPARRPGLGLLLPQPDARRAHLRRRPRHRRREHVYYIDPWLYNCAANPADSPPSSASSGTIIAATQRALDYARDHGVTLDRRRGQRAHRPRQADVRRHQPGLPGRTATAHDRDDRQLVPVDADRGRRRDRRHRRSARSARKAYYSNYGIEQTDVVGARAATRATLPDGTRERRERDPRRRTRRRVGRGRRRDIDPATASRPPPFVVSDCTQRRPARTTSTCRARRWRRRTRSASRR